MKSLIALSILLATLASFAADERQPDLRGMTDRGLTIEIYSELSPLVINQMHSWHVRVLDDAGSVQILDELSVFGGMPEHDHGLPTQPEVTTQLDNGDYLLEGVRFHMQGLWELQIELVLEGVNDTAIIDFDL